MPGLELRSVSKRFGPLTAVEAVDLDLPAGKFISFLGPSGCGKTTLLRLIAGLETPSSGHVVLDDRDITALPTHQRNIGMVFQFPCALSAPQRLEQHHLRAADPPGSTSSNAAGARASCSRWCACPESRSETSSSCFGRPAPAGRHRPRARAGTYALPPRRAAVRARREAARGDAGGASHASGASGDHHHHRHPRPARGDDDVGPGGGDEQPRRCSRWVRRS